MLCHRLDCLRELFFKRSACLCVMIKKRARREIFFFFPCLRSFLFPACSIFISIYANTSIFVSTHSLLYEGAAFILDYRFILEMGQLTDWGRQM